MKEQRNSKPSVLHNICLHLLNKNTAIKKLIHKVGLETELVRTADRSRISPQTGRHSFLFFQQAVPRGWSGGKTGSHSSALDGNTSYLMSVFGIFNNLTMYKNISHDDICRRNRLCVCSTINVLLRI